MSELRFMLYPSHFENRQPNVVAVIAVVFIIIATIKNDAK